MIFIICLEENTFPFAINIKITYIFIYYYLIKDILICYIMKKNYFINIHLNPHEINSLFQKWKIFKFFTEKLFKIKIFMNIKCRKIEFKFSYKIISLNWLMIKKYTEAVIIGFPVKEASLLLLYDNLYIKSIELKNVYKNKKKIWHIISLLIGKVYQVYIKKGIIKKNIQTHANVKIILKNTQIHLMGTINNIKKSESVFYIENR
uniref:RNA-binding protein n=1 Tax=Lotharella vacuolata TaxID=74820 RepID=A0A0H5BQU5_9EUKA|nr:RNA-binding protein [Lotharella vacuolata]